MRSTNPAPAGARDRMTAAARLAKFGIGSKNNRINPARWIAPAALLGQAGPSGNTESIVQNGIARTSCQ